MTASIRMKGSKNKADTRSIHLFIRLFFSPQIQSCHLPNYFQPARLGLLLLTSCGFRTHSYFTAIRKLHCACKCFAESQSTDPFSFWEDQQQQGRCPFSGHDLYHPRLRVCNIGGENKLQAEVGLGPPHPPTYVKCPEKASLSATSYPIQPTRLPSEQQSAREHSQGTHNLAADKGLVHQSINQSINQSIIKCIHAHCSTGY